ncbi:MAG: hypothetical protein AB7W59_03300 [Acidimicrobiia bacterium]
MSSRTFTAALAGVLAVLGVAIITSSTIVTVVGCVAGVGLAVAVGATLFAPRARQHDPSSGPATSTDATAPAHGGMHDLLDQLYDQPEPGPAVPAPLRLVDADTGELVGDRVARLEERVTDLSREMVDLSTVVQDQAELTAKAFGTLRREVERIGHVFGAETAADA